MGKLGIPRASGARDRWFKSSHPDCVILDSARYANWQSGYVESVVHCGFDSHSGHWKQAGCRTIMVIVVYVVGTSACEAEGMGSTPFGHPLGSASALKDSLCSELESD